jgi:trigger factor
VNLVARSEGEEVLNRENLDYTLLDNPEASADEPLPGLSQALVGVHAADILEPPLSLPESYPDEDLAGKLLLTRVLVKEIKRKVLPELDDDFAQSVGRFETMDEVREALRENLETERRIQADERLVSEAVEAVTSRAFVDIPPVLIEEELDRTVEDMDRMLVAQGLSLQSYFDTTGQSEDAMREEMRERAGASVKSSLVLGAVADAEGIEVSKREIDTALEAMLRDAQVSENERRKLRSSAGVRSNIRSRLRRQRAIQKLAEIVSGGDEIAPEAAEAATDLAGGAVDDTEETLAVEIGG